jgi:PAS domain-containing protein
VGQQRFERRKSGRPVDGELRLCPLCHHAMRFEEGHTPLQGDGSSTPAWICRCGHEQLVRSPLSIAVHLNNVAEHQQRSRAVEALVETLARVRASAIAQREVAVEMRQRLAAARIRHFSNAPAISVLAAGEDRRLLAVNAAACALTGFQRKQLSRMKVEDLCAAAPRIVDARWRRFIDSGQFEGPCRLRRQSGEIVRVHCVAATDVAAAVHIAAFASSRLLRRLEDARLSAPP